MRPSQSTKKKKKKKNKKKKEVKNGYKVSWVGPVIGLSSLLATVSVTEVAEALSSYIIMVYNNTRRNSSTFSVLTF